MIPMMSVSVRLRRDISVTISVSPLFMRFSNRPSLRSFSFALPLTTSVTQLVITNSPAFGETSDFVLLIGQILFARTDP